MAWKLSHYDKREACATLAHELFKRPEAWEVFGYHEDKSDMMTDYYCPARWDGVARHKPSGTVLVVDAAEWEGTVKRHEGGADTRQVADDAGECSTCGGSGDLPDGWTLEAARANPKGWHVASLMRDHPGASPIIRPGSVLAAGVRCADGTEILSGFSDVVSPLTFEYSETRGAQVEVCNKCHGKGRLVTWRSEVIRSWPSWQSNAKRMNWHLERDGKVIAQGRGFFSEVLGYTEERPSMSCGEERASRETRAAWFADRMEALIGGASESAALVDASAAPSSVDAVTVRASDFPGNVEVLFPGKPAQDVRDELKAAGFRWSGRNGCWYGKAARLPARYAVPAST